MSTYRKIHGRSIQAVTTDPTESVAEGQVWYNTTSDTFKSVLLSSTWSSSANTNIPRGSGYGFGTLTAGVTGTGEQGPPGLAPAATEEYNGSGWATGNNYPRTDYFISACGTQTAGLAAGGFGPPKSNAANHYNGTSWTAASANLNVAKFSGGMFGVQTSAIYCGGDGPVPGYVATTELYDGSSWSEVGDLPVAKRQFATAGTSTAGLASGGRIGPGPTVATVDQWDGSSWTAAPSLNTARRYLQGWGIQTSAIVCGGSPDGAAASALTEMYDGTSWSETGDLATARHFSGTSQNQGDNTSGWFANGNAGPTYYSSTEEFDSSANVVTAAAFSSKNGPPNSVYGGGTGGTPTAAFLVGGYGTAPAPSANRAYYQLFDGTNWSEGPDLNLARVYLGAAGTQTAALAFGGRVVSGAATNDVSEEYNGSSWSEGDNLNTARQFGGSCGTQTAALGTGGGPSAQTTNEEYDGTSWTSVNAYPISVAAELRTTGTQTAAFGVGGPSSSTVTNTYDGTNWTSAPAIISGVEEGNLNGTTSDAIHAGGKAGSTNYTAASQIYDSNAWYTGPNLGTGRAALPSGPSSSSVSGSLFFGGPKGAPTYAGNQLEEFTGETTALNVKTLTQS
jgi:hypothetical protein